MRFSIATLCSQVGIVSLLLSSVVVGKAQLPTNDDYLAAIKDANSVARRSLRRRDRVARAPVVVVVPVEPSSLQKMAVSVSSSNATLAAVTPTGLATSAPDGILALPTLGQSPSSSISSSIARPPDLPVINGFPNATNIRPLPSISTNISPPPAQGIPGDVTVVLKDEQNFEYPVKISNLNHWATTNVIQSITHLSVKDLDGSTCILVGIDGLTLALKQDVTDLLVKPPQVIVGGYCGRTASREQLCRFFANGNHGGGDSTMDPNATGKNCDSSFVSTPPVTTNVPVSSTPPTSDSTSKATVSLSSTTSLSSITFASATGNMTIMNSSPISSPPSTVASTPSSSTPPSVSTHISQTPTYANLTSISNSSSTSHSTISSNTSITSPASSTSSSSSTPSSISSTPAPTTTATTTSSFDDDDDDDEDNITALAKRALPTSSSTPEPTPPSNDLNSIKTLAKRHDLRGSEILFNTTRPNIGIYLGWGWIPKECI